jgi:hypothetical protein
LAVQARTSRDRRRQQQQKQQVWYHEQQLEQQEQQKLRRRCSHEPVLAPVLLVRAQVGTCRSPFSCHLV